jgi:hypothetical protein
MFGGNGSVDTWEWNGSWQQRSTAQSPSARRWFTSTYDSARGVTVLFGGQNGATNYADTWEYDGTNWNPQSPMTSPSARYNTAMAFDPRRGVTVLFGGWGATGGLADTWEYDGTNWAIQTPTTSPPAREWHRMAYDPTLGQIVMFGGTGNSGNLADTWTYDGTTWHQLDGVAPPARYEFEMTYDGDSESVLIFGGMGSACLDDLWALHGGVWTPLTVPATPAGHCAGAMAYDPLLGRVVMFGGTFFPSGLDPDTWTLAYSSEAAGEACAANIDYDGDGKAGCADDECWAVCSPECPPDAMASCPAAPTCGDGLCTGVETCRDCPQDCAVGVACPIVCGDGYCDSGETLANCPGDCTP